MRPKVYKKRQLHLFFTICLFLCNYATASALINEKENGLWLSMAPPPPGESPACDMHKATDVAPSQASQFTGENHLKINNKTSSGQQYKRPGRQGARTDFESEHRPKSIRTYFLRGDTLSPQSMAYLLHPDGSQNEIDLIQGQQAKISFTMPMHDDYRHGPNNVYIVDKKVQDNELIIRTAKWITVHHSCRWGHDYRNDNNRLQARNLNSIPLDIVIDDLWDNNFHVRTRSGEQLKIQALNFGKPVQGTQVTLTTEKKWHHTEITDSDGIANIQLIRDYYPTDWVSFKRTKLGHLYIKAQYQIEESGEHLGQQYSKVRYITTLPWRYTPASADYASYSYGLGLGLASLLISGLGVFVYRERRRKPHQGIRFDE